MILKNEDVTLRPWREEDAECLFHFAKNPNIGPAAGWPAHQSVNDSRNIIKTVFSKDECYAVVKDDIPVGCVEVMVHPAGNHWWGEGSAELGYWIAEEYWGNNLAKKASELLVKRAFDELGVERIFATFRKGNNQSERVLEKLGFEFYMELNSMDYLGNPFVEVAMKLEK